MFKDKLHDAADEAVWRSLDTDSVALYYAWRFVAWAIRCVAAMLCVAVMAGCAGWGGMSREYGVSYSPDTKAYSVSVKLSPKGYAK